MAKIDILWTDEDYATWWDEKVKPTGDNGFVFVPETESLAFYDHERGEYVTLNTPEGQAYLRKFLELDEYDTP